MGRRAAIAALAVAVAGLAAATALTWGGSGGGEDAPPPGAPAAQASLDGAALFAAKGCAVCHLAPGRAEGGGVGPDLQNLVSAGATPEYVRESILSPEAVVVAGWGPMPRLEVSDAEADALVAYLLGLTAPRG